MTGPSLRNQVAVSSKTIYFRAWFQEASRFADQRGSEAARECAEKLEQAFRAASLDQTIRADVTPLLRWLRSRDD